MKNLFINSLVKAFHLPTTPFKGKVKKIDAVEIPFSKFLFSTLSIDKIEYQKDASLNMYAKIQLADKFKIHGKNTDNVNLRLEYRPFNKLKKDVEKYPANRLAIVTLPCYTKGNGVNGVLNSLLLKQKDFFIAVDKEYSDIHKTAMKEINSKLSEKESKKTKKVAVKKVAVKKVNKKK